MTNFLKLAENKGHKTINGKLMLLFQAQKHLIYGLVLHLK